MSELLVAEQANKAGKTGHFGPGRQSLEIQDSYRNSLFRRNVSRLMGIDETRTLARLKALRRELIDPKIDAHSSRIVKLMGDGMLVEFGSAVDAVTYAIEIQREMTECNIAEPQDKRIELRIGINVGDIIRRCG